MDAAALQKRVTGTVVPAGTTTYEPLRRAMLWNELRPERRPALIVRVAHADDIVATVEFARASGAKVALRSGGYSWCGAPLRDGGILLDLGRLNGAAIDPTTHTAKVEPALAGRDLLRHLRPHGLAFPVGHCAGVALGGYLLAGGFGWNSGQWGLGCANVQGLELVTAAGEQLHASATEHADLFWAARGAGPGFFAAVTRFHLGLHPLPGAIAASTYVYPLAALGRLARWLAELAAGLDPRVDLNMMVGGTPPREAGRAVMPCVTISAAAFANDEPEAASLLASLETAPVLDQAIFGARNRATGFDGLFDVMDGHFPVRHRWRADALWSNQPLDALLASVPALLARAPSPRSGLLCVLPPVPPDPPALDGAFSMSAEVYVACYAVWDAARDDAANIAWHRDAVAALEPFAVGHYIGESDIAAIPSRAEGSFAPAHWQRLERLRRTWDPSGVFHGYFDGEQ